MLHKIFHLIGAIAVGIVPLAASTICVEVLDPGRLPLPGAKVVVSSVGTISTYEFSVDERGKGCTDDLPEGNYSVVVAMPGFVTAEYRPVTITYPYDEVLPVVLPFGNIDETALFVMHGAEILGTLRNSGDPSPGVKICLFRASASETVEDVHPAGCVTTNRLGQYVLDVKPDVYRVEMTGGDLATPVTMQIDISDFRRYRDIIKLDVKRRR